MTRTVLIEGLIDTLKGIATKIINNPTNSHLTSNVTSETNSVLLTGAAKNTALKELIIDFEPYQRDTPSTEEPATIFATEFYNVFVSENVIGDEEPEGEFHAYAINLGRVVYGGRIDIKNKKVLVTWEYIEEYDGETLPAEWLSTMDVYAEGTTPTTGAGVAYKIAEPYYIDIDGATIKTIAAANDCYVTGDPYFTKSMDVDYVRDEALAIENLEQGGGGGGMTTEVIMGDLDKVYGTTPANYIGTFNQWVSIDEGKSFADYDEIILVSCAQNDSVSTGGKDRVLHRIPVYLLEYYNKLYIAQYNGTTTLYVKACFDYTNNTFFLENFNYLCPIALLGVKY